MSSYKIIETGIRKTPDISIAMLTYNHEKLIERAIESVLMQKTNFSFELVIAEDFSTDRTREIVLKYKELNPQKIKLILQNKNVGGAQNYKTLLSNLSGKYVAILDGDDYWTDAGKLQEQVTFLESNPDFSLCFTSIGLVNNEGQTIKGIPLNYETNVFTHETFVTKISPPTLTTVFRRDCLPVILPDDFFKVQNGDMFLKALISEKGKVKYINKITGNKHQHGSSIYSGISYLQREEKKIITQKIMLAYFKSETVKKNLRIAISVSYARLMYHYLAKKKIKPLINTLSKSIGFYISQKQVPPFRIILAKLTKDIGND